VRSWSRPVATIVALVVVANVVMVLSGMGPNVVLVTALGGLVGMTVWTVAQLAEATPATTPIDASVRSAPAPRGEPRVARLRTGLSHAGPNGPVLEQLHDSLVNVIDDQLRVAHQIDRSLDPVAARAVIGDELHAFIDDPATATADLAHPRRLDRILTLIEHL
jgi:hypothetical protein